MLKTCRVSTTLVANTVGTSLLVSIAHALVALAARVATEVSLDWALIMPFIATAVLGARDGRRLSATVNPLPCSGSSAPCC